ncbi:hypothetical protein FPV67DRAFT_1420547 [Lyophyllum atratum]|nr:hypothetical protein FPV67DRAFT_1420547 [Lyophyllum atratum]
MLAAPAAVLSTASLGDIVNHPPTPAYLGLPLHRGAIDKTTITTHAPPEAMRRVRVALQSMGIIVQAEGEYRYRCIRPRRLLDSEALVEGKDSGLVAIAYGAHTEDPGDEVRFSVEITRLDRLDGTYSLDIRRLKGNLRSYKFVYDSVRTRVSFAPTGTRDGGGG